MTLMLLSAEAPRTAAKDVLLQRRRTLAASLHHMSALPPDVRALESPTCHAAARVARVTGPSPLSPYCSPAA